MIKLISSKNVIKWIYGIIGKQIFIFGKYFVIHNFNWLSIRLWIVSLFLENM